LTKNTVSFRGDRAARLPLGPNEFGTAVRLASNRTIRTASIPDVVRMVFVLVEDIGELAK
jgi:hypothetical protein